MQVQDTIDRSALRWVVDEPADLEFVRCVYDRIYAYGPAFSREDVFDLLEESPELTDLNAGIVTASHQMLDRTAA